jgi:hypothetical protein
MQHLEQLIEILEILFFGARVVTLKVLKTLVISSLKTILYKIIKNRVD